ncbi:hypothetical protein LNQ81_11290 [Myroides sp. M-43]|uniref:hypothetical protein n=1 Tax=Myroides oncorhynchi TaxID=2893756 RepID=UPI001E5A1711|nr:hypothetical protein [Myroides oncorhynchi]MCC9043254.1 hypothetical protein [Myroides oncorhynchi]
MRRCAQVLVGVLVLSLSSLFVGCSADESYNLMKETPVTVSSINIEKKWIVAHYDFQAGIDRNHKEAYQKSAVEIDIMKGGVYNAVDKYNLEKSKGQWELNGDVISFSDSATGIVLSYRIEELNRADATVSPVSCKEISRIELVSFSK